MPTSSMGWVWLAVFLVAAYFVYSHFIKQYVSG
jgi:hypothetical protein